ncbi:MAG: GUN4 domain-containing protein, partial [Snowella sp.]
KFGFSVQKKVWIDCGGIPGEYDWDVYQKFADQVGWRRSGNLLSYGELTFLLDGSKKAHLPQAREVLTLLNRGRIVEGLIVIVSLFSRNDL